MKQWWAYSKFRTNFSSLNWPFFVSFSRGKFSTVDLFQNQYQLNAIHVYFRFELYFMVVVIDIIMLIFLSAVKWIKLNFCVICIWIRNIIRDWLLPHTVSNGCYFVFCQMINVYVQNNEANRRVLTENPQYDKCHLWYFKCRKSIDKSI